MSVRLPSCVSGMAYTAPASCLDCQTAAYPLGAVRYGQPHWQACPCPCRHSERTAGEPVGMSCVPFATPNHTTYRLMIAFLCPLVRSLLAYEA